MRTSVLLALLSILCAGIALFGIIGTLIYMNEPVTHLVGDKLVQCLFTFILFSVLFVVCSLTSSACARDEMDRRRF